jgi:uncharacterized membrane-anchored protein YhcB (DUF1043 family)
MVQALSASVQAHAGVQQVSPEFAAGLVIGFLLGCICAALFASHYIRNQNRFQRDLGRALDAKEHYRP